MTSRENMLRTIRFERPDYIPMCFCISDSCYEFYGKELLFELIERHRFLFPDFKRPIGDYPKGFPPIASKDKPYTDDFGCVWKTAINGITGTVIKHPLADWDGLEAYSPPDPRFVMGIGAIDWEQERELAKKQREHGDFISRGLRHGHTFLQLCDIRGYENLMYDMADEEEKLWRIIEAVEEFNSYIVEQYVAMDIDMMGYAEDLGMQASPMVSPEHFCKYIKPSYTRLMKPAKDKGVLVHMHSDGYLHDLIDDIVGSGVDVINMQDLVNGIDWIKNKFAGKVCIDLDIDRQSVTASGTPQQIDALIREEVATLSCREGGLSMIYGLYPGVPVENIKALMDAMERYAFYY